MRWLRLGLIVFAWLLAIFAIAVALNMGDCGPDAQNCGETSRRISFVLLAFGLLGLGFHVVRFFRRGRK